jgi:hypothetical protein
MGGACSAHGEIRNEYKIFIGNLDINVSEEHTATIFRADKTTRRYNPEDQHRQTF